MRFCIRFEEVSIVIKHYRDQLYVLVDFNKILMSLTSQFTIISSLTLKD